MQQLVVSEEAEPPVLGGGYVFNDPGFQALKPGNNVFFSLRRGRLAVARINFRVKDNTAVSGYGATFGSVDCLPGLTEQQKRFFLGRVTELLAAKGIEEVIIRHRPQAYGDNWQMVFASLNFTITHRETNQHLPVTGEAFYQRIKYNEQKKLKQAEQKGYRFTPLTIKDLPAVYALVADTRIRKGYPVSMSLAGLQQVFAALPEKYLLFGLLHRQRLIAAAVSIKVSVGVLYNFYHADDATYRPTSPLVMLLAGIYAYCQQNEIKILDLGVSSEDGRLNEGLFTFKKNLGCVATPKNPYKLEL